MPTLRPVLLGALALPVLSGCLGGDFPSMATPPESVAVHPQATEQFMLKFKDGRDEGAVRASLARLSQAAGLELVYLRPMAGQAHVLRFPAAATPAQVEQALRALQALPEVEYAELDQRVTRP
ncbi:MAG: S8 family serine peptidase [Pseudomonadota bacterium]